MTKVRALLVGLERLPLAPARRLSVALVDVLFAAAVLSGAVIVGHDLREWRAWYGDPATAHPWAPTPAPSATVGPDARRP